MPKRQLQEIARHVPMQRRHGAGRCQPDAGPQEGRIGAVDGGRHVVREGGGQLRQRHRDVPAGIRAFRERARDLVQPNALEVHAGLGTRSQVAAVRPQRRNFAIAQSREQALHGPEIAIRDADHHRLARPQVLPNEIRARQRIHARNFVDGLIG